MAMIDPARHPLLHEVAQALFAGWLGTDRWELVLKATLPLYGSIVGSLFALAVSMISSSWLFTIASAT